MWIKLVPPPAHLELGGERTDPHRDGTFFGTEEVRDLAGTDDDVD